MDGNKTPLGAVISPANNHEMRHIERLLDSSVVELIAPHRKNRKKPPTQDGRKLRRMKRARWRIERTNVWLQSYGRIAVRKDRLGMLFLGWTQLACLFIILKRFRRRFMWDGLDGGEIVQRKAV